MCHIIDLSECHGIRMRAIALIRDLWFRRAAGETLSMTVLDGEPSNGFGERWA